jgi:hypothetical protein
MPHGVGDRIEDWSIIACFSMRYVLYKGLLGTEHTRLYRYENENLGGGRSDVNLVYGTAKTLMFIRFVLGVINL